MKVLREMKKNPDLSLAYHHVTSISIKVHFEIDFEIDHNSTRKYISIVIILLQFIVLSYSYNSLYCHYQYFTDITQELGTTEVHSLCFCRF